MDLHRMASHGGGLSGSPLSPNPHQPPLSPFLLLPTHLTIQLQSPLPPHSLTWPYMGSGPLCVPALRVVNHTRSGSTASTRKSCACFVFVVCGVCVCVCGGGGVDEVGGMMNEGKGRREEVVARAETHRTDGRTDLEVKVGEGPAEVEAARALQEGRLADGAVVLLVGFGLFVLVG